MAPTRLQAESVWRVRQRPCRGPQPDIILAHSTPSDRCPPAGDADVPIVMTNVADVADTGFVAAHNRPAGNTRGIVAAVHESGIGPEQRCAARNNASGPVDISGL